MPLMEDHDMSITRRSALAATLASSFLAATRQRAMAGAPIKLGLLHTLSPAPFYMAQARGYFAASGCPVEFVFFESAQPIAAAAVSGDIDIGVTALTGGFFSLAGRGTLKVIGGALHEQQGFDLTAIVVSKAAYDAGLTSVDKLAGHSFAITQYGSSFHYMVGRIAERAGFDLKGVTLRPLQSLGNMVAAVRTGQVDATMAIASMAKPLAESGEVKIIGWVGDMVPYQITALFTTNKMIDNRADDLRAFCGAYQHGVADYRAAFLTHGAPAAASDAAIADIRTFLFATDPAGPQKIREGIGWYDEGAALDVADVKAQLAWFTAQNMVKGNINADDIIDTRFLPTR
jgi:NitT/TauT family transport system substrate-binding protein